MIKNKKIDYKKKIKELKNKLLYTSYSNLLDDLNIILIKYLSKTREFIRSNKINISDLNIERNFPKLLDRKKVRINCGFFISSSKKYINYIFLKKLTNLRPKRVFNLKNNLFIFLANFKKNNKTNSDNTSDLSLLPPPPLWSRIFIWTLSIGSFSLLGWSILTTIEETIILSGELITVTPEAKVSSKDPGRIIKVLVSPNQYVEKDKVLIIYEDDDTNSRLKSLRKRLSLSQYQRDNIYKSFELRLKQLNQQIVVTKDIVSRLELLSSNGAISEINFLEKKSELNDLKINYKSAEIDMQNALFQNSEQLEELEVLILELEAKVKRFQIKSPVSGYIQSIKYQSPGERILSNEVIATVVPDKDLVAKTFIPSKVSAPIQIGMEAKVEVDAYPSSDFGSIIAEVSTISPTTTSDENGGNNSINQRTYVAEISFISPEMPDKLNISDLRSGMAVTAKIKLRDKPIISSAFTIISDIFDPLAQQR